MKNITFAFFLIVSAFFRVSAQTKPVSKSSESLQIAKPKLVIGLVIDQMRWDYLYKYSNQYSSKGFKRLLAQGFSYDNTDIPYVPTYTAAGHACVYTGSVPAINGIMGNNWFDKRTGKNVYCTQDSTVTTVGSNSTAGNMSPENLWTTTITDELRLSTNFQSKVIGIGLKDRGAILPAGHSANAAYWYDETVGKFITSSFYMMQLPEWVNKFNNKDLPSLYMKKDWNTLYPMEKYTVSTADNVPYEVPIAGEKLPVFPHRLSDIKEGKYGSFKFTPFANSYTFDFAKASIENENLGVDSVTDFLAVSISSTDYIGHLFGPNSIEVEDTYYRLDNDIAIFLEYLDAKLGEGNYLLFLTADHGVAHIPAFLKEHRIPAGNFDDVTIMQEMNIALEKEFGINNIIQNVQNYQFYISSTVMEKNEKDLSAIKKMMIKLLKEKTFIVNAFEIDKLNETTLPQPQKIRMANGYNPVRSGDIIYTVKPGYFDGVSKGTTHGLWNPYDAHIPNVWYGWNIKHGKSNRQTYMTDFAPTIAALLKIQMPNGNVGMVLEELME